MLLPVFCLLLLPLAVAATDSVEITGFARCALTSRFMNKQFQPFLKSFQDIPKDLNITYHPLATGERRDNGSRFALCMNGPEECELQRLQCCTKKYVKNANSTAIFEAISCIQSKETVKKAVDCLPKTYAKQIARCAESQEGELLLIDEPYPSNVAITLPYIKINGVHSRTASQNFQKVICGLPSAKQSKPCLTKPSG